MSDSGDHLDSEGLAKAALAIGELFGAEAKEQHAYLHRFADGNVSLELEWISPQSLARTAVAAYLAAAQRK